MSVCVCACGYDIELYFSVVFIVVAVVVDVTICLDMCMRLHYGCICQREEDIACIMGTSIGLKMRGCLIYMIIGKHRYECLICR